MTIRQRLTLWYGGILLLAVILTAGMMYFELIVEQAWRAADGRPHDPVAEEIAEVIFFCLLPLTDNGGPVAGPQFAGAAAAHPQRRRGGSLD